MDGYFKQPRAATSAVLKTKAFFANSPPMENLDCILYRKKGDIYEKV